MAREKKKALPAPEAEQPKQPKVPKFSEKIKLFIDDKRWTEKGNVFESLTEKVEGIPSRFKNLNYALTGNENVLAEWGRMIELWGENDCGKTTFCVQVGVDFQNAFNEPWFYCDSEKRLNKRYAKTLGLNESLCILKQPAHGEEAFEQIKGALRAGIRFIVNDSLPGNVPKAVIDGTAEESHWALAARLTGTQMGVLRHLVVKHKAVIVFVNQMRTGNMSGQGDPNVTMCGKATPFWVSYRFRFYDPRGDKLLLDDLSAHDKGNLTDGQKRLTELGKDVKLKIVKNKSGAPMQDVKMRLFYGKGFETEYSVLRWYQDLGLIEMSESGKSITYNGSDIQYGNFINKTVPSESFQKKLQAALEVK